MSGLQLTSHEKLIFSLAKNNVWIQHDDIPPDYVRALWQKIEEQVLADNLSRNYARILLKEMKAFYKAGTENRDAAEKMTKELGINMNEVDAYYANVREIVAEFEKKVEHGDYQIRYSLIVEGNEYPKKLVIKNQPGKQAAEASLRAQVDASGDCELHIHSTTII